MTPSQQVVAGCAVLRAGAGRPVVCVPGFADSARSWLSLVDSLAALQHEVSVIDLPGFGAAPPPERAIDIATAVDLVVAVVRRGRVPVAVIGHSVGSVIAVRAAHELKDQCAAVVSLEGNLLAEDAYFTGQAAGYADPATFKRDFSKQVDDLVAAGRAPASYVDSLRVADPGCMWSLGRDASAQGADGSFGREFRDLAVPALYLWSESTTPAVSRDYATSHLRNRRLSVEHHWPWAVDADLVAGIAAEFTAQRG